RRAAAAAVDAGVAVGAAVVGFLGDGAARRRRGGGPGVTFLYPQALLLLVPFAVLLWRWGRLQGPVMILRIALLTLLTLALAQPHLNLSQGGSDVVVVVDRSRSMPAGSEQAAEELIKLLQ